MDFLLLLKASHDMKITPQWTKEIGSNGSFLEQNQSGT